jgi:hypothetical protein
VDTTEPDRPPPLAPIWPDAPRHAPDLKLPATRFVPGLFPHPRRAEGGSLRNAPTFAPGLPAHAWRRDASWLAGVDLYHQGYLWEAHEAWEAVYFAAENPTHRALVQALIQLAAAELNAHRGLDRGVRFLATSVERRLLRVTAATPPGERVAGLDPLDLLSQLRRRFARALDIATPAAAAVERHGDAVRLCFDEPDGSGEPRQTRERDHAVARELGGASPDLLRRPESER